jgi:branched-chain amino acid transport system ATP-binding protein
MPAISPQKTTSLTRPDASPSLLRFHELSKAFGGQTVLDGVSGEIRPGEIVLLRGENGSGKTTLLNILSGCLEPDRGDIEIFGTDITPAESFRFPQTWHRNLNPFQHFTPERVSRLGISRTWQDIRLIPSLDLADNIAVATPSSEDSPWSALFRHRRAHQIYQADRVTARNRLADLGLQDRDSSSVDKVSLGQSKRVAIARGLQANARVLLLDEPLNGLDAAGIAGILGYLQDLASSHRVAVVVVEHVLNMPHILPWVETVWTLRKGRLLVETPAGIQKQDRPHSSGEDLNAQLRSRLGVEIPTIQTPLPHGAHLTVYRLGVESEAEPRRPVLEVRELKIRRGARPVIGWPVHDLETRLATLTFTLCEGDLAVLAAPNGWGKTTLLDAIAGVIPVSGGEIRLLGRTLGESPPWSRRRAGINYLPANCRSFESLFPRDVLELARSNSRRRTVQRHVGSLSGGERQMLALNSFDCTQAMSLLDEPFRSLDRDGTDRACELIAALSTRGAVLVALPSPTEPPAKTKSFNES